MMTLQPPWQLSWWASGSKAADASLASTASQLPVDCGCGEHDATERWLCELHELLLRTMRPCDVHVLRTLPIVRTLDGQLRSPASHVPLYAPPPEGTPSEEQTEVSLLLSSAAVHLSAAPRTEGQSSFLKQMGVLAIDGATAVRAVAQQHANGRLSSVDECWCGLLLVQAHLLAFLEDEAERAGGSHGAHAALQWLQGALLIPCTDGALRAACECSCRTMLGVSCPGCCAEGGRGRARPELPPRMRQPSSRERRRAASYAEQGEPLQTARADNVEPIQAAGPHADSPASVGGGGSRPGRAGSAALQIREAFESAEEEARAKKSLLRRARLMVTHLKCDGSRWAGARCSACVSEGRVAWSVRWKSGEMAVGVGIHSAPVSRPSETRFSLTLVVDDRGGLSIRHAGRALQPEASAEWPALRSADVLSLFLDADAGSFGFAVLDCSSTHLRWPLTELSLPAELRDAALFPTLSLRRGARAGQAAEAAISFAASVQPPREGYRPFSTALASQRGGGRSRPLSARLPSARELGLLERHGTHHPESRKAVRGLEGSGRMPSAQPTLRLEQLLLLLGARAHLPSCEFKQWWALMLSEATPAALVTSECAPHPLLSPLGASLTTLACWPPSCRRHLHVHPRRRPSGQAACRYRAGGHRLRPPLPLTVHLSVARNG